MSVTVVETVVHAAPLGLRLRDAATGLPVADGIEVVVQPLPHGRPIRAIRSLSGAFGIHGHRADALRAARVDVRDRTGRFHDFSVRVDLPFDGVLHVDCGSPPASPPEQRERALPLFSRPARPAPAGMAAVRARLLREADRGPAVHAALDVTLPGGARVRGIADDRGEVLVLFPYPQPSGVSGSPPSGTKLPLAQATWDLPVAVSVPADGSPPDPGALPDVCTFLDQSPAMLLTSDSPPTELHEGRLEYGRELVLPAADRPHELLVR